MMCLGFRQNDVSDCRFYAVLGRISAFSVEMMGLIGAGNNPMVGMTVAVAVAVQEALNK